MSAPRGKDRGHARSGLRGEDQEATEEKSVRSVGRVAEFMVFFDERGIQIPCHEWLKMYERYYFLGGTKVGRKITGRNQSSRFVEDSVCSLLSSALATSRSPSSRYVYFISYLTTRPS